MIALLTLWSLLGCMLASSNLLDQLPDWLAALLGGPIIWGWLAAILAVVALEGILS